MTSEYSGTVAGQKRQTIISALVDNAVARSDSQAELCGIMDGSKAAQLDL